ncbi:MAG: PspA-associated protein PspAB [Candidatus Nitrosocosmicus sp.]
MKFFRRLLNKIDSDINTKKQQQDDSDIIFSLTSASISIEEKMGLQFSGSAALCVKGINGSLFQNTIKDCTDLLDVSKIEFKFNYRTFADPYDYLWFIVTSSDIETKSETITNIAAGLSSIGDIVEENGFEDQILSAIFKYNFGNRASFFGDSEKKFTSKNKNLYLIYNYKTNNFYPYIPLIENNNNKHQRDTTSEMQTLSILKNLIEVEIDITRWYPIYDIPF